MNKLEPVDEHDVAEDRWQTVPNRKDLRGAGLTLRRRRAGYFRRQAIKKARLAHGRQAFKGTGSDDEVLGG